MRSHLPLTFLIVALLFVCDAHAQVTQKDAKRSSSLRLEDGIPIYRVWLEQDARWIIQKGEVEAFKRLTDDEQRDLFIEQFWLRRNPSPQTLGNEFKIEHYRRLLYAKEHFAEDQKRGWETDRGRVFVVLGKPDEVEDSSMIINGTSRDSEVWHYRSETKIHPVAEIRFVDACSCREFHLADESLQVVDKSSDLAKNVFVEENSGVFIGLSSPPKVQNKDLEEVVAHKVRVSTLPIKISSNSVPITDRTSAMSLRMEVRSSQGNEGATSSPLGTVRYFGWVMSITGRIVEEFEGKNTCTDDSRTGQSVCVLDKDFPLPNGLYRVDVAVSDEAGTRVGTTAQAVRVY